MPRDRRASLLAAALGVLALAPSAVARADEACSPSCGPGQVCYQGICMVPAPPPAPEAAPSPPAGAGSASGESVLPPGDPPSEAGQPAAPGAPPPQSAPGAGYAYPPPPPPPYGPPRPLYGAPPPAVYMPPPPPYAARPYGYQPPVDRRSYHRRPLRRFFLATPYLGISSFLGETADIGRRSVGARAGAILGLRLHPAFSLNGEISLDVLNFRDVPSGQKMGGGAFALSASPLFHLFAPTVEVVFGPRVGVWGEGISRKVNGVETIFSVSGFLLGLNAGLFFPVRRCLSVGGLVTLDTRRFGRTCTRNADGVEACSEDNLPKSLTNLTVNFAMMF